MSFFSRVKASYFSHPLYGHGYQCQGGYGGTLYEVDNVSELLTAAAASGSKTIRFTTAGTYTLTEDLDIDSSYVTIENSSGGAVVLTGGGLRIGSSVTDVYVSGVEVDRGDIAITAANQGDPIHVNSLCDRLYFYKCAFYHGVDDSSVRSGGVTFDLCQFGPNWDSQYNDESESNGDTGHAFGPFTTAESTGASFVYCLFHSLEDRAPQFAKGNNYACGCVTYNSQLGPTIGSGGGAAYGEFVNCSVIDGPETTPGLQQMGFRINSLASGVVRNCLVDGSRDSETDPDIDAVFPSDTSRLVDFDPTVNRFPRPAPDTAANDRAYTIANVGPSNPSATLAAYLAHVNAGTGSILRS